MEGQRSEAEIRGKPLDGPVSKYINRKVSRYITRFILKHNVPLTPNQVSLIAFLLAVSCLPVLAWGYLWIGGILAQASSIIDGVDGELARARGVASRSGGFVDSILDRYADVAVMLGLASYAYSLNPSPTTMIIAMAALAGDIMVSYLHARSLHDLGLHPIMVSKLGGAAGRDVRLFIIFIGCLVYRPLETLVTLAILTHSYVVYMAAVLYFKA